MIASPTVAPFDAEAATYDDAFTATRLGRWLRDLVRPRLAAAFPPGSRVLELGCGTGEDAVWLGRRGVHVVATDAAPRMVQATRAKAARWGVADRVHPLVLRAEDLPPRSALHHRLSAIGHPPSAIGYRPSAIRLLPFDGAFSNFGGLNCVADLRPVAQALAAWLRPGGTVTLVLMGPWCPWETVWYLAHGQPRLAVRRWRSGGATARIGGQTLRVFYPTPAQVAAAFAPLFRVTGQQAIGALLPPSYLSGLVDGYPAVFATLAAWEPRVAARWPFTHLNDHYLLELTRTEVPC